MRTFTYRYFPERKAFGLSRRLPDDRVTRTRSMCRACLV